MMKTDPKEAPQMNVETMKRLYQWGALHVFEVKTCNPVTWSVKTEMRTFNEGKAKELCESLIKSGILADIWSYYVKFDGEFSNT